MERRASTFGSAADVGPGANSASIFMHEQSGPLLALLSIQIWKQPVNSAKLRRVGD